MTDRPLPQPRDAFRRFTRLTTRWMDNDVYGHVNSVIYYSFFDTAVNGWLMQAGVPDIGRSDVIGLVVETQCNYFEPVEFPTAIDAGLRVEHIGRSSVRWRIGLFAEGRAQTAAAGHFVHVYVDRATRRPVPLPGELAQALEALL